MEFPLSKREKRLFKEIVEAFRQHNNSIMVDNESEFIESKEIMDFLLEKGFVRQTERKYLAQNYSFIQKPTYVLQTDLDTIMSWFKDQDRKANRLSRREWTIAIVSAIVGALIGLIPSFIDMYGYMR